MKNRKIKVGDIWEIDTITFWVVGKAKKEDFKYAPALKLNYQLKYFDKYDDQDWWLIRIPSLQPGGRLLFAMFESGPKYGQWIIEHGKYKGKVK